MAIKKSASKKKAAVKTKHTGDILMDIKITVADGSVHERQIKIGNPNGCMLPSKSSDPDYIIGSIKGQLAQRFGSNNVK